MGIKAEDFPDRISTWSDLAHLVEHFSYFTAHDWLFRGVTDVAHRLVPKIGRETTRARKQGARIPYRIEDERAVLTMFMQQARAHLQSAPGNTLEWLAVAQHFGLPTRLLDWTDSLLAAAWFAVEKAGAKKADSAVWVTRGIPAVEIDSQDNPLTLKQPRVYRPPHISPRIGAQGSVFIICPKPTKEVLLPFVKKLRLISPLSF